VNPCYYCGGYGVHYVGCYAHSFGIYDQQQVAQLQYYPGLGQQFLQSGNIQFLGKESNMALGYVPSFDEKTPFGLFNIGTSGFCGWYKDQANALAEAERHITGNKSLRFAIVQAVQIIEAEPVKTRVRELK
jgi:hypothetical protein